MDKLEKNNISLTENEKNSKNKQKSISVNEYKRIDFLFKKWKSWLFYITSTYIFIVTSWSLNIFPFILKSFNFLWEVIDLCVANSRKSILINFLKITYLITVILIKGFIFCIDGIISSWLKSPFGQINYSINKSNIGNLKSDEIATILTEVNEHFKETFKKLGVFKIIVDIGKLYLQMKKKTPEKLWNIEGIYIFEDIFFTILDSTQILSIFVPIFYGTWRIRTAETLINNLNNNLNND